MYLESKKKTQMTLFPKQKQTHRLREQTFGCQGEVEGEGQTGSSGLTYTHYYSSILGLENLMDSRAWWAAVHGVAKSRARLSD